MPECSSGGLEASAESKGFVCGIQSCHIIRVIERPPDNARMEPTYALPLFSITSLKRARSSPILLAGSWPNSEARDAPNDPPGGSYCSVIVTLVVASPIASKTTDPACSTTAPFSVLQPIRSSSTSLIISASHAISGARGDRDHERDAVS